MFIMLEVSWESREECCVAGLPRAVEVRGFPSLACSAPEGGRGQYKTKTNAFQKNGTESKVLHHFKVKFQM